jgi:hypothetical protein
VPWWLKTAIEVDENIHSALLELQPADYIKIATRPIPDFSAPR